MNELRQLGIPLTVIFPRAVHEPASNGCWLFAIKRLNAHWLLHTIFYDALRECSHMLYDHKKTIQMDTTGSPVTLIPINLPNNTKTHPETLLSSNSSPVTQQLCHGRSFHEHTNSQPATLTYSCITDILMNK